jgi:hypothetical protein
MTLEQPVAALSSSDFRGPRPDAREVAIEKANRDSVSSAIFMGFQFQASWSLAV